MLLMLHVVLCFSKIHDDDDDLNFEVKDHVTYCYLKIKKIFCCTNILIRRFSKCSLSTKTILFKSHCNCMYDDALWKFFKKCSMNRFCSCYNKCIKAFFWI